MVNHVSKPSALPKASPSPGCAPILILPVSGHPLPCPSCHVILPSWLLRLLSVSFIPSLNTQTPHHQKVVGTQAQGHTGAVPVPWGRRSPTCAEGVVPRERNLGVSRLG